MSAGEPSAIERAGRLAGHFAAEAVCRVSTGEALSPLVAGEREGERKVVRLDGEDLQVDLARAKRWLQTNPDRVERAVAIVDGYVTLAGARRDALIIDAVAFDAGDAAVQIILPYRPAAADGSSPFAVHRPKFAIHRTFQGDVREFASGFRAGADAHAEGKAIWDAARDESI